MRIYCSSIQHNAMYVCIHACTIVLCFCLCPHFRCHMRLYHCQHHGHHQASTPNAVELESKTDWSPAAGGEVLTSNRRGVNLKPPIAVKTGSINNISASSQHMSALDALRTRARTHIVPACWFLVLGSWFLVPGYWFLVVGFWLLVSGGWFLVVVGGGGVVMVLSLLRVVVVCC